MAKLEVFDVQQSRILMLASYANSSAELDGLLNGTGWTAVPVGGEPLFQDRPLLVAPVTAFAARQNNTVAISFQGTNNSSIGNSAPDWFNNLAGGIFSWAPLYLAYNDFFEGLFDYLGSPEASGVTKILVTGHSQGAAIAEFFMDQIGRLDARYVMVSYASPGIEAFIDDLGSERLLRIEHSDDPVVDAAERVGFLYGGGDAEELDMRVELGDNATITDFGEHRSGIYSETVESFFNSPFAGEILSDFDNLRFVLKGDESDNIFGTDKPDVLFGRGGQDNIFGGKSRDLISGGDGADDLRGEQGNDEVYGGASFDFLYGGEGNDLVSGDDGFDFLYGETGSDTLFGGVGNDTLYGGEQQDAIFGGDDSDVIFGEAGNDDLRGESGNDTIEAGDAEDLVYGGDGTDTLYGGNNNDTLFGENSDDFLFGGSGNNYLDGGANTDTAVFEYNWELYKPLSQGNASQFQLELTQFERGTNVLVDIERLTFKNKDFSSVQDYFDTYNNHVSRNSEPDPVPLDPDPFIPSDSTSSPTTSATSGLPLLFVNNSKASIVEGDGGSKTAYFEVNLATEASGPVSFTWAVVGGTKSGQAETGSDFDFQSGTYVIPAGQTTVFLPVEIKGDTKKEPNESFSFIVANVSGVELASGGLVHIEKGWILDDDSADAPPPPEPDPEPKGSVYLSIETNDPSELEGSDGSYVEYDFIIRRTGDLNQRTDFKIEFDGYGSSPLTADDFWNGEFPSEHGRFSTGEERESFTVRVRSDSIQEANEYFRARLLSDEPNAIISDKYAYAAVLNDDGETLPSPAGEVYLSIRPLQTSVVEGTSSTDTPIQFEVVRTGDLSQVTGFRFSGTSNSSAETITSRSGDWGNWSSSGHLFNVGQESLIITRDVDADSVNEPDETLKARISSISDYPNVEIIEGEAEVVIINDDGPAPAQIFSDAVVALESDSVSTVYVRVELSHVMSVPVTMDYSISGTGAGTDFVSASGTFTVPSGQLFADLPVQILGDNISEPVKHVEVELENPINGYFGRSNIDNWDTGVVIFDDEAFNLTEFNASFLYDNAIDLGTISKYDTLDNFFILDDNSSVKIFKIETTDPIGIDRDGAAPSLIFDSNGRLIDGNMGSFDYNDRSELSGMADGFVFEPGEYFFVYSGAYSQTGVAQQVEYRGIPSPSEPPLVSLLFSTTGSQSKFDGNMDESGPLSYRYAVVELSHEVEYDVTLDFAIQHLTTSSDDFSILPNERVTISAGDRLETILIRAENDELFEGTETYLATLSNLQGGVFANGTSSVSRNGQIIDDDENPSSSFDIQAGILDRAEGGGLPSSFTFTVFRSSEFNDISASVEWAVFGTGASPASKLDFVGNELPNGTLSFGIGETEKEVSFEVLGDGFPELDETFSIYLSNPSSGFEVNSGLLYGTIRNDDGLASQAIYGEGVVLIGVSYALSESEFDAILVGGSGANLEGNAKNNSLSGNNANNEIIGKEGSDKLFGLNGFDILFGGFEGDHLDGGSGNDTLFGGADDDFLMGGAGNDTINGDGGNDTLFGGIGDDRFFVDSVFDRVNEQSGEGYNDFIFSDVSLTNALNVERLYLNGTADLSATGLDTQSDVLVGNAGNNTLDGKGGVDMAVGGLGNDFYFVDHASDVVYEAAGEGSDYIFASTSFTNAANVERLYLTGSFGGTATGLDSQRDILIGNTGNNTLDGKAGADVMRGELGNDVYYVDNAADLIVEFAGGGADYIYSSVSFQNSAHAERLYLTGNTDINGLGRDGQTDVLIGNIGNNTIDGMGGIDVTIGGLGNDTYFVDHSGDVVIEQAGQGYDRIYTSVSYQAGPNVERLIAQAGESGAVGLTARNFANNIVIGNEYTNVFIDQFGRDIYVGGGGTDYFRFIANLDGVNNVNRINDFNHADDQFQLLQAVYDGLSVGMLSADEFHIGTSAQDADDRIIYDQANGVIYYDPDGIGGDAQVEIVNVTAGITIDESDFQVF